MTDAARPLGNRFAVRALVVLGRLVIGGVFLYASLGKITDPASFAQAVYNYHLIPLPLLHPFALLLPWLEAVAGLSLILGLLWRGGALICLLLTTVFTFAVASALARQLDISCGCFHTSGGSAVGASLLWRDLALLVGCLALLLIRRPASTPEPSLTASGNDRRRHPISD